MSAGSTVAAVVGSMFTGACLVLLFSIKRLTVYFFNRWQSSREAKRAEQVSHVIKRRPTASTQATPHQ